MEKLTDKLYTLYCQIIVTELALGNTDVFGTDTKEMIQVLAMIAQEVEDILEKIDGYGKEVEK